MPVQIDTELFNSIEYAIKSFNKMSSYDDLSKIDKDCLSQARRALENFERTNDYKYIKDLDELAQKAEDGYVKRTIAAGKRGIDGTIQYLSKKAAREAAKLAKKDPPSVMRFVKRHPILLVTGVGIAGLGSVLGINKFLKNDMAMAKHIDRRLILDATDPLLVEIAKNKGELISHLMPDLSSKDKEIAERVRKDLDNFVLKNDYKYIKEIDSLTNKIDNKWLRENVAVVKEDFDFHIKGLVKKAETEGYKLQKIKGGPEFKINYINGFIKRHPILAMSGLSIGTGLGVIGAISGMKAGVKKILNRDCATVRYTDHKSMPWASKTNRLHKLRYIDTNDPNSNKLSKLIDKTIKYAKEERDNHPIVSDIVGVLLKLNGIILSISTALGIIWRSNLYVATKASSDLEKHLNSEKVKQAMKEAKEGLKEAKGIQRWLANKVMDLERVSVSPKLFLLKGLLASIGVGLGAYVSFATAEFLKARKRIEES